MSILCHAVIIIMSIIICFVFMLHCFRQNQSPDGMPERMYDAVMVYYNALKITIAKGQDTRNGVTVMQNAKYMTIKSK